MRVVGVVGRDRSPVLSRSRRTRGGGVVGGGFGGGVVSSGRGSSSRSTGGGGGSSTGGGNGQPPYCASATVAQASQQAMKARGIAVHVFKQKLHFEMFVVMATLVGTTMSSSFPKQSPCRSIARRPKLLRSRVLVMSKSFFGTGFAVQVDMNRVALDRSADCRRRRNRAHVLEANVTQGRHRSSRDAVVLTAARGFTPPSIPLLDRFPTSDMKWRS